MSLNNLCEGKGKEVKGELKGRMYFQSAIWGDDDAVHTSLKTFSFLILSLSTAC